jgi:hypothetical protein
LAGQLQIEVDFQGLSPHPEFQAIVARLIGAAM